MTRFSVLETDMKVTLLVSKHAIIVSVSEKLLERNKEYKQLAACGYLELICWSRVLMSAVCSWSLFLFT
jgi:hypothetical protein